MLVYSIALCCLETLIGLACFFVYYIAYIVLIYFRDFRRERRLLRSLIGLTIKVAIPIYVLAAISFVSNSFLITDGTLIFDEARSLRGAFFALRLVLMAWFSLTVANTLSFQEFSDLFEWLLRPLKALKVPVNELVLTATLAMRFIPETYFEFDAIRSSAWSRGAKLDRGGVITRTKAYSSCLMPLLIRMMESSNSLVDALKVRCWGMSDNRYKIFGTYRVSEIICVVISFVLLVVISVLL